MDRRQKRKSYSSELKLEAVRLFLEEGRTQAEIAQELGVRGVRRIKQWVHDYRKEGTAAFGRPKGRQRKDPESLESEVERLRMENALLKKFHAELRREPRAKRNIGRSTITGKNTK